jgi:hypothetical protein
LELCSLSPLAGAENGAGGSEGDTVGQHQLQEVATRSSASDGISTMASSERDQRGIVSLMSFPFALVSPSASLQSAGHGVANLASAATASAKAAIEVKW